MTLTRADDGTTTAAGAQSIALGGFSNAALHATTGLQAGVFTIKTATALGVVDGAMESCTFAPESMIIAECAADNDCAGSHVACSSGRCACHDDNSNGHWERTDAGGTPSTTGVCEFCSHHSCGADVASDAICHGRIESTSGEKHIVSG